MNWKVFIKKYQLILLLSFTVVVLGLIKMTYKYDEKSDPKAQAALKMLTPIPTITPTPTFELSLEPPQILETPASPSAKDLRIDEKKYPLWNQLPYYGKGFIVDQYSGPGILRVQVSGIDKKIARQEVELWIKKNGIDPKTQILEMH